MEVEDLDDVRDRFDAIGARLAESVDGATICVGLGERRRHETLADLVARAAAAMTAQLERA